MLEVFFMEANKKIFIWVSLLATICGVLLAVLGILGIKFVIIFYSLISIIPLWVAGIPRKDSSNIYKNFFLFSAVSNILAWVVTLVFWSN